MKILHIDDSFEIRKLYSDMLALENHTVTSVSNGIEGLKLVKTNDYDLILLDMWMPQSSGINFMSGLKEIRPSELPKVVITSAIQFNKDQVQNLMEFGIKSIMEKPSDLQKLKLLVKNTPKISK